MAYASRQSSYLVAGLGALLQTVAASAEIFRPYLIRSAGMSWSPGLLLLYVAVGVTLLGVWNGVRNKPLPSGASLLPVTFVNIAGLKLAGVGCIIELAADACWVFVHIVIRSELGFWVAYSLLTVGLLTVCLGAVVGLTIEYGMIQRELVISSNARRILLEFLILLMFSSIWLAAATALIYVSWVYEYPILNLGIAFFLALIAVFVLVPLKKVMPRIGSGVGVGLAFNGFVYAIIVVYAGSDVYVPLALIPIVLFELCFYVTSRGMAFRSAAVMSSIVTGVLFDAMYYPFTGYLFPWSFLQQPLIVVPVVGSAVGALLGVRVYTSLASAVLNDVAVSV